MSPARDLTCNLGMCPDQESNQRPFGLLEDTHPTEPHQSGLFTVLNGKILSSVMKCSTILPHADHRQYFGAIPFYVQSRNQGVLQDITGMFLLTPG